MAVAVAVAVAVVFVYLSVTGRTRSRMLAGHGGEVVGAGGGLLLVWSVDG